jgi:hypothetical protein
MPRKALCLLLPLACLGLLTSPSSAQQGGVDINMLALDWARGRYSAPLACLFDGEPVRGMRRVLVGPGSRNVRPPVGRLVFVDLEVEKAERCFTDFGEAAPNLKGSLQIRLPSISRTDTAQHDFKAALRRDGGFDFDIVKGSLLVSQVGQTGQEPKPVDFRGGVASLRELAPGSDAARLLAEFASPRKLHLRISTRSGESFELDMLLSAPR